MFRIRKAKREVVKQIVKLKIDYLLCPQTKDKASTLTQVRLVTPSPLMTEVSSLTQVRLLIPFLLIE